MPFEDFEMFHLKKSSPERETALENLKEFKEYFKETAERLRQEGVPVDENLRIRPEAFARIHSLKEIESDIKNTKEKMTQFDAQKGRERKEQAELLEKYVVVLFNKHFGNEFLVTRTAEYDDLYGHADNILVDKKRGTPVCAFDEVSVMSGPTYESKKEEVLKRNLVREGVRGGVTIKYGFTTQTKGEKTEIVLQRLKNVPVFYLALSKEALAQGIKEFTSSKENTSEYEQKMVRYFLTSLRSQVARLRLEEKRLSPEVLERINFFEQRLNELSK